MQAFSRSGVQQCAFVIKPRSHPYLTMCPPTMIVHKNQTDQGKMNKDQSRSCGSFWCFLTHCAPSLPLTPHCVKYISFSAKASLGTLPLELTIYILLCFSREVVWIMEYQGCRQWGKPPQDPDRKNAFLNLVSISTWWKISSLYRISASAT